MAKTNSEAGFEEARANGPAEDVAKQFRAVHPDNGELDYYEIKRRESTIERVTNPFQKER